MRKMRKQRRRLEQKRQNDDKNNSRNLNTGNCLNQLKPAKKNLLSRLLPAIATGASLCIFQIAEV
jgi:hypothetical protein